MSLPKRVHFSDSPLVYSYIPATPRTPSPTWSDEEADSDSDSGPSTPPASSTFPQRPLPSLSPASAFSGLGVGAGVYDASDVKKKPTLSSSASSASTTPASSTSSLSPAVGARPVPIRPANPSPILFDVRAQVSPLVWDVSTPPAQHASVSLRSRAPPGASARKSFIKTRLLMVSNDNNTNNNKSATTTTTTMKQLSPGNLSAPATNPGLTSLEIHIPQLPPFWKPVQLRRPSNSSSSSSPSPITVVEVLNGIYAHLDHSISQKEFAMLPKELQNVIARAYWRRHDAVLVACEGKEEAEEVRRVKKAGIKRVDALNGFTRFVAFTPTPTPGSASKRGKGEKWQLILGTK